MIVQKYRPKNNSDRNAFKRATEWSNKMQNLIPQLDLPLSFLESTCRRFLSDNIHYFDSKLEHTKHLDSIRNLAEQLRDYRARLQTVVCSFDRDTINVSAGTFYYVLGRSTDGFALAHLQYESRPKAHGSG